MARARSEPGRSPGPRRRRTAEEARELILDAAERRLREGGPDAIRLQDIAREAGISHPTILHHFESREGLTRALQRRAMQRLESELVAALEAGPPDEETLVGLLERIFASLGDAGQARLLAWRALHKGDSGEEEGATFLRALTDVVHRRRRAARQERGRRPALREDSEFMVRLTTAALLGDSLFGPQLDHAFGRRPGPDTQRRFRAWLARLLLEHGDRD